MDQILAIITGNSDPDQYFIVENQKGCMEIFDDFSNQTQLINKSTPLIPKLFVINYDANGSSICIHRARDNINWCINISAVKKKGILNRFFRDSVTAFIFDTGYESVELWISNFYSLNIEQLYNQVKLVNGEAAALKL